MHDGSKVCFSKLSKDYDPTNRSLVTSYLQKSQEKGEIPTGLLYVDPHSADMHDANKTIERSLFELPFEELCPGSAALDALQKAYW